MKLLLALLAIPAFAVEMSVSPVAPPTINVDNSTLCVDSVNNRVGIGTCSPSLQLYIKNAANGTIGIEGASGSNATIQLYKGADVKGQVFSDSNDDLHIRTQAGGDPILFEPNAGEIARVDTAGLQMTGAVGLYSRTVAQLAALTPTAVGQMYYCSNCTALRVCVSTGTAQGQFSSPVAATTTCQ